MRLNLRRAAKRRLPKRDRVALYVPKLPDIVWSMDFMSDALACGRHSRSTSISSQRLVRVFEQLKRAHGLPHVVRSERKACPRGTTDLNSLVRRSRAGSKPTASRSGMSNAVAESFFSVLKKERIKRRTYPTRAMAASDVFDYIEMFYNPIRRHGSAGGVSPVEFERRYAQSGN